jgi:tetratricopeptide (TPR) repeat protein
VLSDSPETTGLYLRRAMDYYHTRDFDACLADLDKAIALQPLVSLSYFLRAQVRCAQLQASSISVSAQSQPPTTDQRIAYGKALDDLARVMELEPDMSFAQYNIGNIYVRLHEYDKAIDAFTRVLEIDPRFPDAYYNRGVVYLLDGRLEKGLADLSQAGEYGLYSAYNLIKRYSKTK